MRFLLTVLAASNFLLTVQIGQLHAEEPKSAAEEPSVLFEDDFESGSDRWEIVDPESWKVEEHG